MIGFHYDDDCSARYIQRYWREFCTELMRLVCGDMAKPAYAADLPAHVRPVSLADFERWDDAERQDVMLALYQYYEATSPGQWRKWIEQASIAVALQILGYQGGDAIRDPFLQHRWRELRAAFAAGILSTARADRGEVTMTDYQAMDDDAQRALVLDMFRHYQTRYPGQPQSWLAETWDALQRH
jgi:hypothetical protein